MSLTVRIPAISIWETFNETIPRMMTMQRSEKSAEHLLKIIKSQDFSSIFVYSKDPQIGFEQHEDIAGRYKAFTTWFLGRFFYLLNCEKLSRNHKVYVEIQICVLEQLSNTWVHVYDELANEYCKALRHLSQFLKSGTQSTVLEAFIPVNYADLCEQLKMDPIAIEINKKNIKSFILNLLKIIGFILDQRFDFQSTINGIFDDLLFLLSECPIMIKIEILKIYLEVKKKHHWDTFHRMDLFSKFFEQLVYEIYSKKMPVAETEIGLFEPLLVAFLEQKLPVERFHKVTKFLLKPGLEITPSPTLIEFCRRKRKKPLYEEDDFENYTKVALTDFDTSVLCGLKAALMSDLSDKEGPEIHLMYTTGRWKIFHKLLLERINTTDCAQNGCKVGRFLGFLTELGTLLTETMLGLKPTSKLIYFNEKPFLIGVFSLLNRHFSTCDNNINVATIYDAFLSLIFVTAPVTVFFDVFTIGFGLDALSLNHFLTTSDYTRYKKELSDFTRNVTRYSTKETAFKYLNTMLIRISCGYFDVDQDIEINFFKVVTPDYVKILVGSLGDLLTLFRNTDRLISEVLVPALTSDDESVVTEAIRALPKIICVSSSGFVKVTRLEATEVVIETYCDKCNTKFEGVNFDKIEVDLSNLTGTVLKNVLKCLTFDNPEIKILSLGVLPYCSNHILKFHSGNVAKIWMEKTGDPHVEVRRKFAEVAPKIIKNCQENKILSDSIKKEVMEVLYRCLMETTKRSLKMSDYCLQETLLQTLKQLPGVTLPTIKILIYLIMVPTSKYSLVAVNHFMTLTETPVYKLYRREICETVAHLCVVNQTLVNYPLAVSLCKVAVALDFSDSKDFVTRECHHLVPFFVSKVVKNPTVGKLIEQMALLVNVGLSEFLASIYGHIFLHVFLNESKEDFKQSTLYLEKTTGLPSSALRKRSLFVIHSELLLNFHEKREKVLLALRFLAKEDTEAKSGDVREYLQPRLLGLLQHFDFKLISTRRKDSILLSLADFFKYMGSNYIGPLRFKIIAMLRTVVDFPELNCEVWDAFIRSCDVGSLAPQLATIFVSLLPLIEPCPKKVNDIFKYLIVDNENQVKDSIKDLFFVTSEQKIDPMVNQTIKKYVKRFDDFDFGEKMKTYLKYLTHETIEVRVRSLKQLKVLMEKNREELDQMILGYNGIDPAIVDLIEILTLGCREKDPVLKLACGEVIGELGAVEPSHLPRRYAKDSRFFTFFMDDDGFIVNALNELIKALQGEKNTVNMDRYAVAIQEVLKSYEISSDESSSRNDLWKQFPDAQQELMAPLLTSRYILSQFQEVVFPSPIYGTADGATFQMWLYNWTRSLIMTLPQKNQTVLTACLPAMKQDNRILMQFLPYILLHSIISDSSQNREKSYTEIKAVIGSFNKQRNSDLLHVKPNFTPTPSENTESTKVVFVILDFLDRWTREWQWKRGSTGRSDPNFVKIRSFLQKFCKLQLAVCNYRCGEYPRALMYLEDFVAGNPNEISKHWTFLAEIYAQLDEPDGVAGVTVIQPTEPPIEQRILSLEVSGKLSDAAACYECLPKLKAHHLKGLIRCYLDLDNISTALNFAKGALERQIEYGNMLLEMQAEPLWRLGRYEDLDSLLKRREMVDNTSWGVQVGRALLSFQNQNRTMFSNIIEGLKSQQVEFLGAASVEQGAYQHGYCYITRLHSLNELQQVEKATYALLSRPDDQNFVSRTIENLTKEWELRVKVVQESVKVVEPLLCLRRVALEQSKRIVENRVPGAVPMLNSLLGECWLLSAKTARCAGMHHQGFTYTIKAEEYAPPSLFVEKSQLHWSREEHEQALTTLKRGLEVLLSDNSKEAIAALSIEKRKICAEAKLLIACYNDAVSNVDTDIKTANYREASDVHKEWETGLVKLAQFFDRRFQNFSDEERDSKGSEMQILIINYFCKSLRYGTAFVYQSLPRLLSIWFDYGTRLLDVTENATLTERKNNLVKMTKLIDYALENLPAYVFLTAFSQIISRICHPQKEVYVELKSIIIKLLLHYPQQCLWMIISVMKSSYLMRAKRCAEIFSDQKLKTNAMVKLVGDFTNLAVKLIELCNKNVPADVETTTVSSLLRALPRLLSKPDFSEIMIPTHKFRKLVLPNPDFSSSQHNPFPNHYVHIIGIDEEVTLIRSLQKPRKITLRGSDGRGYIQMLKPKDDLRKDFRLMEFNDIVNQLLSREPESRQRRLNIRLYSVAPLNEECGLIEWVPNLVGLRPIVQALYKQRGIAMTGKELRDASCNIRDPLSKKREAFTRLLLPRHPPVLGEWFRKTFPDPQSWFFARTAYIRTTAAMSMVGYILGLGDRHGENILFDSTCGDVVHVDFNCLFNKGETFEWAERVPFRLTHNMVAAMGPLGVEGVFRKSCACTLKVLRDNTDTLMSIVTPFVYDPLVSWHKNASGGSENTAEKTNEQALDHVKNIQLRLQGIIVKSRDRSLSIPLSVDGQTNSLINEAVDIDNLCQMYIGWGPYL